MFVSLKQEVDAWAEIYDNVLINQHPTQQPASLSHRNKFKVIPPRGGGGEQNDFTHLALHQNKTKIELQVSTSEILIK